MQLTKTWLWKQQNWSSCTVHCHIAPDSETSEGAVYSASKLIRKSKPVTTNHNLLLVEHGRAH